MDIKTAIICVDPGHGGSEPGTSSKDLIEKDLNLKISKYVQSKLNSYGATVKMTRTTDTKVSLGERTRISNNAHADVFVSVHVNGGSTTASGIETWVHDNASSYAVDLCECVQNELIYKTRANSRGIKRCPSQRIIDGEPKNIYVVDPNNINAWAVLPEIMFISNPNDYAKLEDEAFLQKVGYAIAGGIYDFINNIPFEKQ